MPLIYLTGLSGTGKSTILRELAKLGYTVHGVDEESYADWVHRSTGIIEKYPSDADTESDIHSWYSSHRWVLSPARILALREEADSRESPIILAGVAEGEQEIWDAFHLVFALCADDATLSTRIAARTGNAFGKTTDELNAILGWNDGYRDRYLSYGAVVVEATRPLNRVVETIATSINCLTLTPITEVNTVLSHFTGNLHLTFPDTLIATYLTGSLTYGGFELESSDIDLLAVLSRPPTQNEIKALQECVQHIADKFPSWGNRIECSFIPEHWLSSTAIPADPRPYLNGGSIRSCRYGNEWAINLNALHECGRAIHGPAPSLLSTKVPISRLQEASRLDLEEEWLPRLDIPSPFEQPGYDPNHLRAYAVLTMCRILHRDHHSGVASKREAAAWVCSAFPEWASLVSEATEWRHGASCSSDAAVLAFISFTAGTVLEPR